MAQERRNYQKELKERVTRLCYDAGVEPAKVQPFYDFVKQEALDSYKNGLAAGRQRASTRAKREEL